MDLLLSITAFLLTLIGIAGCVIPVLPGPLLSYAGLLCAGSCSYSTLQPSALWLWFFITLAVTVADYLLPGWLAGLFGGSRAGRVGATLGMIAGFLFFNLLGVIVGPFVGACIGELLNDNRDTGRALRVGFGSFLSFLVGTGLKLTASTWMLACVIGDTYPALKDWFATLF